VTGRGRVGGIIFCRTLHGRLWTACREKAAGALVARGGGVGRTRGAYIPTRSVGTYAPPVKTWVTTSAWGESGVLTKNVEIPAPHGCGSSCYHDELGSRSPAHLEDELGASYSLRLASGTGCADLLSKVCGFWDCRLSIDD